MQKRYVAIWFRYLKTDWYTIRQPELSEIPFVLAAPNHGRMLVTAVNPLAQSQQINPGIVLADARALVPSVKFYEDHADFSTKLLTCIAKWCIRFTPFVAIDLPDGIILDVTGCSHLWGGEKNYLNAIKIRFKKSGYNVRLAMANTIAGAWAAVHYNMIDEIIDPSCHKSSLLNLPIDSLRLPPETVERLHKLGLSSIQNLIEIPRIALRRRFGNELIRKLDQALGVEKEFIDPIVTIEPYEERLPCLEPIITSIGIEIALKRLLGLLSQRLHHEQKGIRSACFKSYRVDNKIETISIGTNRASCDPVHLFKLFEEKISEIDPGLGIELFILSAQKVEDVFSKQERFLEKTSGFQDTNFSNLMDRLTNKIGAGKIHRYLPDEHHWPERSIKLASSVYEKENVEWISDRPRPVILLTNPEPIEVTAPIPDYPPMLFRYKNKLHKIKKADGPERIEREWWLDEGPQRDYYYVEDEQGYRYWLFRSGHYEDQNYKWFLHGFFA